MNLERNGFSRLAEYVKKLPEGLASYPHATTRSDYSLILRPHLAHVLTPQNLPLDIYERLTTPWKQDEWIPEIIYVALCEIARDHLWTSEEAYHKGMFDVAIEMYRGPFLKALFVMLGPSIMVMNGAKRWNRLHQGSTLVVKKQHKEAVELILNYPPHIFSESGMKSLGAAMCAAVEVARGKSAAFEIISYSETQAEVMVKWSYWNT